MEKISYPIDATFQDILNEECPILNFIKIIDSKWKFPILWYLHEKNSTRYNELKRRIPNITNIMLTKSLRELERDGLIERKILKSDPPKEIFYSLTELGKNLMPAMNEIYSWSLEQMKISKKITPMKKFLSEER